MADVLHEPRGESSPKIFFSGGNGCKSCLDSFLDYIDMNAVLL